MLRSKDEIMASLKLVIGDDTSDETIALLEDISDTLDAGAYNVDWKGKCEETEREWRERYKAKFFEPTGTDPDPGPVDPETEKLDYDDLFDEEEE